MSDESATGDQSETGDEIDERPPGEDGRFDAEYVGELRSEAATRRRKARELEQALEAANATLRQTQDRLVELTVIEATRGIMADPDDLLRHVEAAVIMGDDGGPDPEKIKAAARDLVERKPHLGPRRPAVNGDVDQGARPPTPEPFDFAAVLRRAAG